METIKDIFAVLFCAFMVVLISITIGFPVIISIVTGNWWYLFLFFAIGIPVVIEWFILMFAVELLR
jgi:hypothetical protein